MDRSTCLIIGFLIGLGLTGAIWAWTSIAYGRILQSKADPEHRTAECINGKFYFIVPEKEYCELTRRSSGNWDHGEMQEADGMVNGQPRVKT